MGKEAKSHRTVPNPARRHFLAISSAAAARSVAVAGVIAAIAPGSANAMSRPWRPKPWKPGTPGGNPTCFLRGTRILTNLGEVPVEELAAGDTVICADGRPQSVRWVQSAEFHRAEFGWDEEVVPICFRRSSIAEGVPSRDLYLSPWHFVHFDGMLMPARDLVNEVSIVAETPADVTTLEYFHVLLDSHALLLAEGVQAESLLFNAAPSEFFAEAAYEHLGLNDDVVGTMEPCLPRVWYSGGRSHLAALLRLGVSTIVDVRDPIQRVNARLAHRVTTLLAA